MPVLKNPKHERFAQELAKGKSASLSYEIAYGTGGAAAAVNASKLLRNANVRDRVTELQERGARRAEVTVQTLLEEAEAARLLAMSIDQPSAAIAAIREKGVLSGKRVERTEAGKPGEFDRMSEDELRNLAIEQAAALGIGRDAAEGTSGQDQARVRGKPSGLH